MESRGHFLKLEEGLSEEKRCCEEFGRLFSDYLHDFVSTDFWGRYLFAVFFIAYLFCVYAVYVDGYLILRPRLLLVPYFFS